jgi:hypothetical protein
MHLRLSVAQAQENLTFFCSEIVQLRIAPASILRNGACGICARKHGFALGRYNPESQCVVLLRHDDTALSVSIVGFD